MTVEKFNITEIIAKAERTLLEDKSISPQIRTLVELLLVVIKLLADKLSLNSRNSSKGARLSALGKTECPAPNETTVKPKRGRTKKSKSRNLLERLWKKVRPTFATDEKIQIKCPFLI